MTAPLSDDAQPSDAAHGFRGLWLPLITPFRNEEVDLASVRRLVRHYAAQPIDGLILCGTTGEAQTLDADETARMIDAAAEALNGRLPLWLGLSGADTRRMARAMPGRENRPIDGYLLSCPYYSRPSQEGLFQHFATLAGETARPVSVYNIPYRTGVNMRNETLLRLAALPNIVGVKDCCAEAAQSAELRRTRPRGLSVMTGEDSLLLSAMADGGDGGVLASLHIDAPGFARLCAAIRAGDMNAAEREDRALADIPPLLFAEPNPGPVKHWLWRLGLIDSPELRLPMTPPSATLTARIDRHIAGAAAA